MASEPTVGTTMSCDGVTTRDWRAWVNLMPPKPDDLHVVGEVLVPNPGVEPLLTPRIPQGINPAILMLDLLLLQRGGIWPQVLVWRTARYDKIVEGVPYEQVQVMCGSDTLATVAVETIS